MRLSWEDILNVYEWHLGLSGVWISLNLSGVWISGDAPTWIPFGSQLVYHLNQAWHVSAPEHVFATHSVVGTLYDVNLSPPLGCAQSATQLGSYLNVSEWHMGLNGVWIWLDLSGVWISGDSPTWIPFGSQLVSCLNQAWHVSAPEPVFASHPVVGILSE